MITGLLSFSSTKDPHNFNGLLRLSKDPKGIEITKANLLLRQERLISGNWVIGLAVSCGRQSFYYHKEPKTH
jgi:hypothetical protein